MQCCKIILSTNGFKKSCNSMLKACGWFSLRATLKLAALKFLHSILISKSLANLFSLFKISNRRVTNIALKEYPQSKHHGQFFIYKALQFYNNIPVETRELSKQKFKLYLEKLTKQGLLNSNLKDKQ